MSAAPEAMKADVVCFGMIIPAWLLEVEAMPPHNTGAMIQKAEEFISDDAAIVACLLRQWEVKSGLIGTALGDDARGRQAARRLADLGVLGKVRLDPALHTPYEVDISDRTGARTYFWERHPRMLATLDDADLGLLEGAGMLYVDWYDGDHILRAMDEARRLQVPVFLNFEFGHQQPDLLHRYAGRATICQAVTDAAQSGGDPNAVADTLLSAGVQVALVTLAGEGCLVATANQRLRLQAIPVKVVDGCGAGAAFSAGFMDCWLRGENLESSARFATAAATLKCTVVGMHLRPRPEVRALADQLVVQAVDMP
jgi:sugar/nucleoside kinase (ribokinase family)